MRCGFLAPTPNQGTIKLFRSACPPLCEVTPQMREVCVYLFMTSMYVGDGIVRMEYSEVFWYDMLQIISRNMLHLRPLSRAPPIQ